MKKIKKCDICSKEYLATSERRRYCSDPCRKEANRRNIRERNRQRAEKAKESVLIEVPEKKKKEMSLTEMAAAARKAGMTYGQYMAKMELQSRKEVKNGEICRKLAESELE